MRVLAPQTSAEPQRSGIVVGGVTAFAPGDAVDRVLDQSGRIGHSIQMIKRDWSMMFH
jgi:hypothetical protein